MKIQFLVRFWLFFVLSFKFWFSIFVRNFTEISEIHEIRPFRSGPVNLPKRNPNPWACVVADAVLRPPRFHVRAGQGPGSLRAHFHPLPRINCRWQPWRLQSADLDPSLKAYHLVASRSGVGSSHGGCSSPFCWSGPCDLRGVAGAAFGVVV